MKQSTAIAAIVLVALVVGAGGFVGGMQYQKTKKFTSAQIAQQFSRLGNRGTNGSFRQRFGNGGGAVRGSVTAVSGNTMTVQLQDGSSKIVLLGSSATVTKSVNGTAADVTVGQSVMVLGTANSDGSVTATQVQLNPTNGAITSPATPGQSTL